MSLLARAVPILVPLIAALMSPPLLLPLLHAQPQGGRGENGERVEKKGEDNMVLVPAGPFWMGADKGEVDERPRRRVKLPAFRIDRFEVTQQEYNTCVKAEICRPPKRYQELQQDTLPAIGVTWGDAQTYCLWRGKRLPTEAEWERAARGTDGRRFPWGNTLDCHRGNFGNFLGAGPCASQGSPGKVVDGKANPYSPSPAGAYHMAGNVWEWVADTYGPYPGGTVFPLDVSHMAQTGVACLSAGHSCRPSVRVVRGGSCCSYFALPTTTNRLAFPEDYADNDLGFRCASDGSGGKPKGNIGK